MGKIFIPRGQGNDVDEMVNATFCPLSMNAPDGPRKCKGEDCFAFTLEHQNNGVMLICDICK